MKRYYVVLEVHHGEDQLDPHEMATWIASMLDDQAEGFIGVTVYESAADLYSERCAEIIVLEEED